MSFRLILCTAVSAVALCGIGLSAPAGAAEAPAAVREVLPRTAVPVHYDIAVEPDAAAMTFKGSVRAVFDLREPTTEIVLNAADLNITEARLEGGAAAQVVSEAEQERVRFRFAAPLQPGRHTLVASYDGKINETANGLFAGAYKGADGSPQRMLVTQFEPGDARRLAPMWDEPSLKATFTVEAIIPAGQMAVSNMPVAEEAAVQGGKKRVRFEPSVQMSSYLLFLGVGDLERLEGRVGKVDLGIVAKAGDKAKGAYALESTQQLLPYYETYFGAAYQLPKLDQVAVAGAGGFGAMENWGAILYFEPFLLFDPKLNAEADKQRIFTVVAHEIAHQWFGNLVTMSWWDDLWLNEGFASWMETKATAELHPEWNPWLQSLGSQEAALSLDARSSTHPVVQPVANVTQALQAFDTITYSKGEAVIRMIEAFLGEEAFREGVQAYMKKHAYQNTVTDDLWGALEAASGTPVKAIAADFTLQGGVPLITVNSIRCSKGESLVSLSQGRFGVDAPSKEARTWRTPVTVQAVGSGELGKLVLDGTGSVRAPGCGAVVVNKDRTGYYRVKYADKAFVALRDRFAELDTADQLALLYDAWSLGAAGEAPITRYLELAARAPADADPLVQRQIVGSMARINGLYDGQPGEAEFKAYAAKVLKPMLERTGWEAKPGEPPNTALFRSSLIGTLGGFDDAEVIAEAQRRFAAAESNAAAMPPALRNAILGTVGYAADASTWTALVQKAAAAKSPLEQRQFLSALAQVKDESLAKKSLDLFLTEATPKQLGPGFIAGIAGNHPDLAWNFYLANREAVDSRLDPLQRLDYPPSLAAASSDPKRVEELRTFAAQNLPADAEKSVKEAVAAIEYDIQVKSRLPEITRWIARNNKG